MNNSTQTLEELISIFRPTLGNMDHIRIVQRLNELNYLRGTKTKQKEKDACEADVISLLKKEIEKGFSPVIK